jgi:hypothetical protein
MDHEAAAAHMRTNFPPAKAEMYIEGMYTVFQRRHAGGKSFVKFDPEEIKPEGRWGDPRLIQARDPVFTGHLYPLYKLVEHVFYKARYLFNRYAKYTCAKGWNLFDRIFLLLQMVEELGPGAVLCVSLDGKRFDGHVCAEALRLEWDFVLLACKLSGKYSREQLRELKKLARMQERNRYTAFCNDGSVRYYVKGGRMSGDLNTGCGNSILQSIFLSTALKECGVPEKDWRMLVDGDDAFAIVRLKWRKECERIPDVFRRFNQEISVSFDEVDVNNLERVEFCRSRPVRVNGEWRFCRNPYRAVNRFLTRRRWFRNEHAAVIYLSNMVECELIVARDVPILDPLFRSCHVLDRDVERVAESWWQRMARTSHLAVLPERGITHPTRVSFEKAWGIPVSEQIRIENSLPDVELVRQLLSSLNDDE